MIILITQNFRSYKNREKFYFATFSKMKLPCKGGSKSGTKDGRDRTAADIRNERASPGFGRSPFPEFLGII